MNTDFVHVSGWTNGRRVVLDGDSVQFEVAVDHNHCPTCAERVRHVKFALSRKGIGFDWRGGCGSSLYVVLPPLPEGRELKQYLGESLDLRVA